MTMKAILFPLLVFAFLLPVTVLASPLPADCRRPCESNTLLSRWRGRDQVDGGQTALGQQVDYVKAIEDFISMSQPVSDEDEDDFQPWPTPVNPAERPMSTTQLMRQHGVFPDATTVLLPSAPTGGPHRVATP